MLPKRVDMSLSIIIIFIKWQLLRNKCTEKQNSEWYRMYNPHVPYYSYSIRRRQVRISREKGHKIKQFYLFVVSFWLLSCSRAESILEQNVKIYYLHSIFYKEFLLRFENKMQMWVLSLFVWRNSQFVLPSYYVVRRISKHSIFLWNRKSWKARLK